MEDVGHLSGDFNNYCSTCSSLNTATTLSQMTGNSSNTSPSHPKYDINGRVIGSITHEYATFEEGHAAFNKLLVERIKTEFPNSKWAIEPTMLYGPTEAYINEYLRHTSRRNDADELTPDMLSSESVGMDTSWVDDPRNFSTPMIMTKDRVGVSTANRDFYEESIERLFAGKAGINWAWTNWFGRWDADATALVRFDSIGDMYPRLKLIRCVANWDNLSSIPLTSRSWDGLIYRSPRSFVSSDVIYSRQPHTEKLFAVFLNHNGVIRLNPGERVVSAFAVDGFFIETFNVLNHFNIVNNEIRLRSTIAIDQDISVGQIKGNGYIFNVERIIDQVSPVGFVVLNSGNAYSRQRVVTLSLQATDEVGVTGYFVSENSTRPTLSSPGWVLFNSISNFTSSFEYTFSSGEGERRVYVWYRDGAGNISDSSSDSIVIDRVRPSIRITLPTMNSIFTTRQNSISISGRASDGGSGLRIVRWRSHRGFSGVAVGTTSWSISGVTLLTGQNIITVTSVDRAGNQQQDQMTITRP